MECRFHEQKNLTDGSTVREVTLLTIDVTLLGTPSTTLIFIIVIISVILVVSLLVVRRRRRRKRTLEEQLLEDCME